jgi:ABC-type branched-subunit amino acid transport system ATPase component
LFNCLSRLYRYRSGDILFKGTSITDRRSHDIARLGTGRTSRNLALFATSTGGRGRLAGYRRV